MPYSKLALCRIQRLWSVEMEMAFENHLPHSVWEKHPILLCIRVKRIQNLRHVSMKKNKKNTVFIESHAIPTLQMNQKKTALACVWSHLYPNFEYSICAWATCNVSYCIFCSSFGISIIVSITFYRLMNLYT